MLKTTITIKSSVAIIKLRAPSLFLITCSKTNVQGRKSSLISEVGSLNLHCYNLQNSAGLSFDFYFVYLETISIYCFNKDRKKERKEKEHRQKRSLPF